MGVGNVKVLESNRACFTCFDYMTTFLTGLCAASSLFRCASTRRSHFPLHCGRRGEGGGNSSSRVMRPREEGTCVDEFGSGLGGSHITDGDLRMINVLEHSETGIKASLCRA